jgi:pimeloyl-ACP methyl ester carboxylesterase
MAKLRGFIKKAGLTVFCLYFGVSLFLYCTQELFIFPVLLNQILGKSNYSNLESKPGNGVESFFATTSDGERIEVWTTLKSGEKPKNVAMIFHGNGDTVNNGNYLPFFRDLGIPAFTFDYRGYGHSSGWPSEQGIYRDAEAVWAEIQKRSGLDAENLIILGNSIGTGPASYLASKLSPKALILIAAYSDFPKLISGMPMYAPFLFTLRYKLPVNEYIQNLSKTCLIIAHGKKDTLIPFSHLNILRDNIPPNINSTILESDEAGHNDIFYKVEDRLKAATQKCVQMESMTLGETQQPT